MIPELIESSRQMDVLLKQLNTVNLIAVDTEFFRETTYYPQLALVQIATGSIVACIDPLSFDAKPALKKLLLDNDITKIF
ncbi:MAG: ribonuclease D, partial [Proteobacteria bacterium]|nr:ribonuclease D [Pseudomonadota bacterium]